MRYLKNLQWLRENYDMHLQVYQILDDKERNMGFKYRLDSEGGIYDSHGSSYVYVRKMLKEELGHTMGLDKVVEE